MLANTNESVRQEGSCKRAMQDRRSLLAAAEALVLWKSRLGNCLRDDRRELPDSGLPGQDGICRVGNWINGPAFESFCDLDEYRKLTEAHRQFECCTELILKKLKSGDRDGADAIFQNEFSLSLRCIINSLTEINRQF